MILTKIISKLYKQSQKKVFRALSRSIINNIDAELDNTMIYFSLCFPFWEINSKSIILGLQLFLKTSVTFLQNEAKEKPEGKVK